MRLIVRVSIAVAEIPFSTAFITVAETPFSPAFITVIVAAIEATGGASRLREPILWRRVEVVGDRVWEVWIDSWGSLVAGGFAVVGLAKKPRGVLGLLHGVCSGRGGLGKVGVDILSPPG